MHELLLASCAAFLGSLRRLLSEVRNTDVHRDSMICGSECRKAALAWNPSDQLPLGLVSSIWILGSMGAEIQETRLRDGGSEAIEFCCC